MHVDLDEPAQREMAGIGAATAALLSLLSLGSYGPQTANMIGSFGHHLARGLTHVLGLGAWCVPYALAATAWCLLLARPLPSRAYVLSRLALVLLGCALLHLGCPDLQAFGEAASGVVAARLGDLLRSLFGLVGAFVVGGSVLLSLLVWQRLVRITWDSTRSTAPSFEPPSLGAPPPQPALVESAGGELLEQLASHGVTGRIDQIHRGPIVTTYEFAPSSGTKLSKIAGLVDDLSMGLGQQVRVAPIPGKARVGFELPNAHRRTVSLGGLLSDRRWAAQNGPLPIALGASTTGDPVFADLSQMPHLLVAGATGSGKSVGLNAMITSLLSARSPDEVRFVLIDPKQVEFTAYDGIPHLQLPVVTEMNEASDALRWAVDEMERRYQLLANAGARNLSSYNQAAAKRRLPHIVLVVDELADVMRAGGEASIARLAQKARAAGIHVILSTQRPSTDVITGSIKANFPTRIAYRVSQREDSRTILGRAGAEQLLGAGDMLMLPPSSSEPKRIHGAHVSEAEVAEFCDSLRAQGKPIYASVEPNKTTSSEHSLRSDPLYERCLEIIAQSGSCCSISQLQRALGIGYNKAAKLFERLEREGVVLSRRGRGRPSRAHVGL